MNDFLVIKIPPIPPLPKGGIYGIFVTLCVPKAYKVLDRMINGFDSCNSYNICSIIKIHLMKER
jgi:hypothetical protein